MSTKATDTTPHRALVLGAAGAIGAAVCRAYAAAGHLVLAADLQAPNALLPELSGHGHLATSVDVTDLDSVTALARWCQLDRYPLQALIYAAGANTTGPIEQLDWAEYDRVMGVNLRGAFHTAHAFTPGLRRQQAPASVVLLASTAGQRGEAGGSVYCASKFALLGLMQSLAAELAPDGVRVNAVAPGNVDSPMMRALAEAVAERTDSTTEEVLGALAAEAAADRLVTAAEVAAACLWLTSAAASGVTGTTVNVDAGTLTR